MISALLLKIAILIGAIVSIFVFGYFKGKSNEKNKQNIEVLQNAKLSKERQLKRRFDDIAVIKQRMQKYIRQ